MVTQTATDIEQIVIDWLTERKIAFTFQTSLSGGLFELGGAVVDFTLDDLNIALRVQGVYYHRGVAVEGSDLIQREMLEAEGYIVVDLWGDDIKDRTEETLTKALRGEGML